MFWILRRIALIEDRLIRSEAQVLKLSPGWHTVRINIRYEKANQVNTTLEGSSVQLKPRVFLGAQKTRRLYGKIMRPGYHASWAC